MTEFQSASPAAARARFRSVVTAIALAALAAASLAGLLWPGAAGDTLARETIGRLAAAIGLAGSTVGLTVLTQRRIKALAPAPPPDDGTAARMHAQKMESLGTLAAGIAHEINTPMQFIGDNLRFIREVVDETIAAATPATTLPEGFRDEVPLAIEESLAGVRRVGEIVGSMRTFAHPDPQGLEPHDINDLIRLTVTVTRNLWKHAASLDVDLDPGLPAVHCRPGEINQVLLNLVSNAVDAIDERPEPRALGHITIASGRRGDDVTVTVRDDGAGIAPQHMGRVFDMFYTTKPAGRGTGQGLAISDAIIRTHGGRIEIASTPGAGTAMTILLPTAR